MVGVSQLVGFARNYIPIFLKLLFDFMKRSDAAEKNLLPKNINSGANIEILFRSFAGFITTVEKIEMQDRDTVLVEFIWQSTKMQIKIDKV
mgnify:CR=1 FL=1